MFALKQPEQNDQQIHFLHLVCWDVRCFKYSEADACILALKRRLSHKSPCLSFCHRSISLNSEVSHSAELTSSFQLQTAHYAENIFFFSLGDSNLIIKLLHLSFTKLLYLSLSYAPFGYKQHLFPLFTTVSHQTLTEVEYPPPNTPQIHFSVHTVYPSSGCLYTFINLSLLCS